MVLNIGEATHILGGIINITLAYPSIACTASWHVDLHTVSNQYAVITTTVANKANPQYPITRWRFDRADWPSFTQALEDFISHLPSDLDIQAKEACLIRATQQAAKANVPQVEAICRAHPHGFVPPRVRRASNMVTNHVDIFKAHPTEDNKTLLHKVIHYARSVSLIAKNDAWLNFCEGLNFHTPVKPFWTQIKIAMGRTSPRPHAHPHPKGHAQELINEFASGDSVPDHIKNFHENFCLLDRSVFTGPSRSLTLRMTDLTP